MEGHSTNGQILNAAIPNPRQLHFTRAKLDRLNYISHNQKLGLPIAQFWSDLNIFRYL